MAMLAITGSSGLVGQNLVPLLSKRFKNIRCIDSKLSPSDLPANCSFVKADLSDYEACLGAFKDCSYVLQLAAIPIPGETALEDVHVHNTYAGIEAGWRADLPLKERHPQLQRLEGLRRTRHPNHRSS
jgi:nucleoside-diphosphate-sugar epimerase